MSNPVETERRNRIRASLFAYAYEIMNVSLIPDAEYDALCLQINPEVATGHIVMDEFFRKEFNPSTGMWIHRHPEIEGIKRIYNSLVSPAQQSAVSHEVTELQQTTQKMNGQDLTGCNSYLMNMIYIASLGFNVVPNGIVEFHQDGITVKGTGAFHKYSDIFTRTA